MKHFIFVFIGLITSTYLGGVFGNWAFGESLVLENLFEELEIKNKNRSIDSQIRDLSDDEVPFENLYVYMFENVSSAPSVAAIESLAMMTLYSKQDLEDILLEGDISKVKFFRESQDYIEGAQAGEVITAQAVLLEEYANLRNLYLKEKSFQISKTSEQIELLANEMFYNGDLNDSGGVDILNDFDLMHFLLFGEVLNLTDRSSEGVVELSALPRPPENPDSLAVSQTDNPAFCFLDEELNLQLENYALTGDFSDYSFDDSEGGNSEVGGDLSDGSSDFAQDLSDLGALKDTLRENSGNWNAAPRGLPCNEMFCIRVNLISQKNESESEEGSFQKTDNFIAAHLSFLREKMEETVNSSLTPGRISTNFFEDATCKAAGLMVNLDFNVRVIQRGIDVDTMTFDLSQKIQEKRMAELRALGGLPQDEAEKTKGSKACDDLLSISNASGVASTSEEAILKCQVAMDQTLNAINDAYTGLDIDKNTAADAEFYEQVTSQLHNTLIMMREFKQALESSYQGFEAPIYQLLHSTPYCS